MTAFLTLAVLVDVEARRKSRAAALIEGLAYKNQQLLDQPLQPASNVAVELAGPSAVTPANQPKGEQSKGAGKI